MTHVRCFDTISRRLGRLFVCGLGAAALVLLMLSPACGQAPPPADPDDDAPMAPPPFLPPGMMPPFMPPGEMPPDGPPDEAMPDDPSAQPPEQAPAVPAPPAQPPTQPPVTPPGETPPAQPGEAAPAMPGETPAVPPPPATPPGETPPAQPGEAAPAKPGEAPAPTTPPAPPRKPLEGPILLNFKDASVRAVLEYLSEAAGLVVVEEAIVDGRITVMSRQPISVDEAVSLLNTILKVKGFAAIRNGRTLRIVALADAKKSALPVRTGIDPSQIEPSDELVTHVIPIQSADAVQLKRDLATLIPTYADLSANQATNSLILTDTQTNVRRFVEIVHALDARMAGASEVKVFQLKYANAANAARLINDLFKQEQSSQSGGASGFRSFMFGGPGGPGGGRDGGRGDSSSSSSASSRQPKVTASSDERTNTLVVSGPPDLLKVIEGVVKELDSNPTEEQAVFIYPLKNAKAINVEAVLNNLFGWSGSTSGRTSAQSGTGFGQGGISTRSQGSGSTGFGRSGSGSGRSSGMGSSRSSSSGGLGSGGLGSSGFGSSGFGTSGMGSTSAYGSRTGASSLGRGTTRMSSSTMASASDLAGQVFVVADEDTNSLLVTAATNNFERIKQILADLDRPVPQVLIKVLIAEVTHNNTLDIGAEFSALNLRASGQGQRIGTDFAVAAQTSGLVFRLLETDVTAAIRLLATEGKLDVLSRPYILTSDNQQASIMVGQEVPFVTRSQLTDAGQTINTIEYDDIGIILTVTPHINPDGLVIMDVYPEISAQTGQTVPISETVNAPVFARRAAQSRVAIRDGQTIVIGGLMEDRLTDNVRKVPLLGDLPWVGWMFRRTTTEKIKTELLIFLTPHVAKVPDDLPIMSANERANTKLTNTAVAPGAFEDHMKGMETGAARPAAEKPEAAPEVKPEAKPEATPGAAPEAAPGAAPPETPAAKPEEKPARDANATN